MDLSKINLTPRTIREIEQKTGKTVLELSSDFSMSTIHATIKYGFGIDDEQADKRIDKYLETDGDLIALFYEIVEQLLKKGLSPEGVKKEMPGMFKEAKFKKEKEAPQVIVEEDSSGNTGKSEKN